MNSFESDVSDQEKIRTLVEKSNLLPTDLEQSFKDLLKKESLHLLKGLHSPHLKQLSHLYMATAPCISKDGTWMTYRALEIPQFVLINVTNEKEMPIPLQDTHQNDGFSKKINPYFTQNNQLIFSDTNPTDCTYLIECDKTTGNLNKIAQLPIQDTEIKWCSDDLNKMLIWCTHDRKFLFYAKATNNFSAIYGNKNCVQISPKETFLLTLDQGRFYCYQSQSGSIHVEDEIPEKGTPFFCSEQYIGFVNKYELILKSLEKKHQTKKIIFKDQINLLTPIDNTLAEILLQKQNSLELYTVDLKTGEYSFSEAPGEYRRFTKESNALIIRHEAPHLPGLYSYYPETICRQGLKIPLIGLNNQNNIFYCYLSATNTFLCFRDQNVESGLVPLKYHTCIHTLETSSLSEILSKLFIQKYTK